MEIPSQLNDEIVSYCKVNNIGDVDKFKLKMLKQGFTIEKYGIQPIADDVEPKKEESNNVQNNIDEINELKLKIQKQELEIERLKNNPKEEKINPKDIYGE